MLRNLAFCTKFTGSSFSTGRLHFLACRLLRTSCQANTADKNLNSSEELVLVERAGDVTFIAINRPHKRNCVNISTAQALLEAFQKFEADPLAKVAVLYGKGGHFCAGWDLSQFEKVTSEVRAALGPSASEAQVRAAVAKRMDAFFELLHPKNPLAGIGPTRMQLQKPLVAAVEGHAVACGLELSLLADLRVADEHAVFGVFCRRFGVPLVDMGTVRLPRVVGLGRALDLVLTGRPVGAREALQMGLANRVVPVGTAVGEAHKLALEIAKFPQICSRADRASVYYSTFDARSYQDAVQFEFEGGRDALLREAPFGATSFIEKGVGLHGSFSKKSE